jgi:hypothetical protein
MGWRRVLVLGASCAAVAPLLGLYLGDSHPVTPAPLAAAAQPAPANAPEPPRPSPVVVDRLTSATVDGPGTGRPPAPARAPAAVSAAVLDAYRLAVTVAPASCHLPVTLLAAIGQVESGNLAGRQLDAHHRATPPIYGPLLDGSHGFAAIPDTDAGQLDGNTRWDRAVGPMQFIPSSWRIAGVDMDNDGARDPQDIEDAAGAAMVYLCANGRDLATAAGITSAVLAYNHSTAYLRLVLAWKHAYDAAGLGATTSPLSLRAVMVAPGGSDLGLLAQDATAGGPVGPVTVPGATATHPMTHPLTGTKPATKPGSTPSSPGSTPSTSPAGGPTPSPSTGHTPPPTTGPATEPTTGTTGPTTGTTDPSTSPTGPSTGPTQPPGPPVPTCPVPPTTSPSGDPTTTPADECAPCMPALPDDPSQDPSGSPEPPLTCTPATDPSAGPTP